ncbi:hypothetical protein ACLB6G_20375 [Zhengella sp. ZM62]|uniref:hypothetical protein n=1 Tax=Zhengella sedimenti TaxID=3390035 RepID=UPI00397600CF
MKIGEGFKVIDDPKAPKGRRIVPADAAVAPSGVGTDSGDQFSDAQLRDAIKEATGKAPGPRTSREKLVEQFNELNAKG